MAPKKLMETTVESDPNGIFADMTVFLVEAGVQPRRLQIWKQKLVQMGANIEDRYSKNVTHVFAANSKALAQSLNIDRFLRMKVNVLLYQWLEDSLKSGSKVPEDLYRLDICSVDEEHNSDGSIIDDVHPCIKKAGSPEADNYYLHSTSDTDHSASVRASSSPSISYGIRICSNQKTIDLPEKDLSLLYKPPDLNRNITQIFSKLVNIYRALGDDRRSFSYYKAISVIEKVPFTIECIEQVKNLSGIGRSLQDHIQEILNTGKLSKLEFFEADEKVRAVSLFEEVWGIGPSTALKLYDKGCRTLDDLNKEDSLTHSQKIGLQYFQDIKTRIPRDEVAQMEHLLQNIGREILPAVDILCAGSYRRGKADCGDLDIVITHHDGQSHIGFLPKFVKKLKEIMFLREDLIFKTHSEEGTNSGVDTYFGLCTYPGRELRHRIDLKVYPREIYAFGLIAWTGNDVLNRRLRLSADYKGYRLDDTGIYPATRSSGGKKATKGSASLKFKTEKEVFDFLGFPWLEPYERNL